MNDYIKLSQKSDIAFHKNVHISPKALPGIFTFFSISGIQ